MIRLGQMIPGATPLGIGISGAIVFSLAMCESSQRPPPQQKTADQVAREAREEAAFQKVARALAIIKKANRNPASVSWENVLANDDASLICIEYRGQNGFGGMNLERVAFINGAPSDKAREWNSRCAGKPLNNMIHARQAVK